MPSLDSSKRRLPTRRVSTREKYSIVFTNMRKDGKHYRGPRFDAWKVWEAFSIMAKALASNRAFGEYRSHLRGEVTRPAGPARSLLRSARDGQRSQASFVRESGLADSRVSSKRVPGTGTMSLTAISFSF